MRKSGNCIQLEVNSARRRTMLQIQRINASAGISQNSEKTEIEGILVIKQGATTESSLRHWLYKTNRLKVKEIQRWHPKTDTFCSCYRGFFCLSLLVALRKENSISLY